MHEETHFKEIDVALMYVEEARQRAERAATALRRAGAEPHLVEALDEAREELSATGKRLLQRTHFAVPSAQATL
jgi:predicted O-methyltransferase YrrM